MELKIKKPRRFLIHPDQDGWKHVDNAVVDRLINGIPGVYFEDRQQYRYLLNIFDGDNPFSVWVNINQRPSVDNEIINYGRGISVIGRQRWNNLEVTISDFVSEGNDRNRLLQILNDSMTQQNNYLGSVRKEFVLDEIDPTGIVIERWRIYGFISQYNINGVYNNGDIDFGSFTIMIDRAVLDL